MATAKDFSRLGDIEEVSRYILVRDDGYVVNNNNDDDVALSSSIVTTGQYCESLAKDLAGRKYIYCCVERASGNDIMVFSLGKYYLGVIKHVNTTSEQLAEAVIAFLKAIS
jgi:hypothetical protein